MNAIVRLSRLSCRTLIVGFVGSVAVMGGTRALADDDAFQPRYKLKVGQRLVYRTAETKAPGSDETVPPKYPMEWTFDVIGMNPDKTWRIVFTQDAHSRTSDGYFDLAADGRLTENETFGPFANPTLLFPPLPTTQESLAMWSSELALDQTRRKFKGTWTVGEDLWKFREDPTTIFDRIYQSSTHREYTFDLTEGLVREVTSTSIQKWPAGRSDEPYVQRVELASSEMQDTADLVKLNDEFNAYFPVRVRCDKRNRQASSDFAHAEELLDKSDAEMKAVLASTTLPRVKALVRQSIEQSSKYREYTLETAERFGKFIGKPSDEWKTSDLDGNSKSLADYRGKVVLLDFWYRGCGWCIRAMPQIKQLVVDFQDQPVAVLGMNNDRKKEDADFVIEAMSLNYETLKNKTGEDSGINESYDISGWPTLVMLDGKGVIRHIHVGYSPTLRQDLAVQINKLLAEQ